MKKLHLVLALLSVALLTNAQSSGWKIVPGHITTQWADDVNPANTLPDYPRPQLQRSDWQNLNGLWQYAILPVSGTDAIPTAFQGNILVPFAVESALSGVSKTVGKDNILWYQRDITVPAKRTLSIYRGVIGKSVSSMAIRCFFLLSIAFVDKYADGLSMLNGVPDLSLKRTMYFVNWAEVLNAEKSKMKNNK